MIALSANAQDKICIKVYQPDRNEIPREANKFIENKLIQLITTNGIADDDINNRFVITCKANITSKDILATTPQRISESIEFTFIVGDVIENKIFESYSIEVRGIGINENKAFIAALNNIKSENSDLKKFLENSKIKITNYYNSKCEQIQKQAIFNASAGNYDNAIYELMQVPGMSNCADNCQDLALKYYKEKRESQATTLLNKAKIAWSKSPNTKGASDVALILSIIPTGTESQKDVEKLIDEINTTLQEQDRREWEQKVKEYNDNIEHEKREYDLRVKQEAERAEYRARQQEADNEIRRQQQKADSEYRKTQQEYDNRARSQMIEACRQIGLEYCRNQPNTINYNCINKW